MNAHGHAARWRREADDMRAKARVLCEMSYSEDDSVQAIAMRHEADRLRQQADRRIEWANGFYRDGTVPMVVTP